MTDYVIDPILGDDAHANGEAADPWRTYVNFLTESISAGDTIKQKAGTQVRGTLKLKSADATGSSGNEVVIGKYGTGANPIANGADLCALGDKNNLFTNGSFEGTWTGSPLAPPNWTITAGGGTPGTITEETSDVYHGSSAAKYTTNGELNFLYLAQNGMAYDNTKDYRISFYHKEKPNEVDGPNYMGVYVGRRNNGTLEFLQNDGTWSGVVTLLVHGFTDLISADYSQDWAPGHIYVPATSSNPNSCDEFDIRFQPVIDTNCDNGTYWYLDAVSIGEIYNPDTGSSANLLENPYFSDFVYSGFSLVPRSWDTVVTGGGVVNRIDRTWFSPEKYSTQISRGSLSTDSSGVEQTGIALEQNTEYKFGLIHYEYDGEGSQDLDIEVYIIRETTTPQYWTGATWSTTPTACLTEHAELWEVSNETFTTPNEATDLTFTIMIITKATTGDKYTYSLLCYASLIKTSIDPIYESYFYAEEAAAQSNPTHVILTGNLYGKGVTRMRLHEEASFTSSPSAMCYSYDTTNHILYYNLGVDAAPESENFIGGMEIECVVRTFGIDLNDNGYIDVEDFDSVNNKSMNISLGWNEASSRKQGITVSRCNTIFSGHHGIGCGYRPADPAWNYSSLNSNDYLVPKDVIIQDCTITNPARQRLWKIKPNAALWYTGYTPPMEGIKQSPGSGSQGSAVGYFKVLRCSVIGDTGMINDSAGNNGVAATLGEVTYEDNFIYGVGHGMYIQGGYVAGAGDIVSYSVKRNKIHHCGDDGMAVWNVNVSGDICYNVISDCGDEGLDLLTTWMPRVYNNTFSDCANECIWIWSNSPGASYYPGGAFIVNNIFYNWGGTFRTGFPGIAMGAAIGFGTDQAVYDLDHSYIDHNHYYSDLGTSGYPFHIQRVQKSMADFQALGFEEHATVSDPRFVDPANYNFNLRWDSPCIAGGVDLTKHAARIVQSASGLSSDFWFSSVSGEAVDENIVDYYSAWPGGVETVNQFELDPDGRWDVGAMAYLTERHTMVFTSQGTPSTELAPTIDIFTTIGGKDITPIPTVVAIAGGFYGFSTRVNEPMLIRVDGGTELIASDRYKYFKAIPDDVTARMINERMPDLEADVLELQQAWTEGGRLDLLLDAIKARTDTIPESFKKNTAFPNFTIIMVDALDGFSTKTDLTVVCEVMGDAAVSYTALDNSPRTQVSAANAPGAYRINLTADDLNYDFGVLRFSASGARTLHIPFRTVP
jgi:hypothetical protein